MPSESELSENTSYFSNRSRPPPFDARAPSISRGVSASYNVSHASLHRVIEKADFQCISPGKLDRQKLTMQEHNQQLAEYAKRNKELNEAITKKMEIMRKLAANKMADRNTEEARQNAAKIKINTKNVTDELEELRRHTVQNRGLDLINQNISGDIHNYSARIEYAKAKIEAVRKSIEKCDEATRENNQVIEDLKKQNALKKVQLKEKENMRDERLKLICNLVSGTDYDVEFSKMFDGKPERLMIEMKILREKAMKEAEELRANNEKENRKTRAEIKRTINDTERLIKDYESLKKEWTACTFLCEKGADDIKILNSKIVAIELRIKELEADYANSEEIADLEKEIAEKRAEIERLMLRLKEEVAKKKNLINQIEGNRQTLDPELSKMKAIITNMDKKHWRKSTNMSANPNPRPGSASSGSNSYWAKSSRAEVEIKKLEAMNQKNAEDSRNAVFNSSSSSSEDKTYL